MLREDYEVYRQLTGGETTSYTVHAGRYKTRPNSVITPTGERSEYASPEEIVRFSTATPWRILHVLQSDPNASLSTISTILGISRSAIQKQVDNLAEKGYISRPEGKKRGWIINISQLI